MAHRASVPPPRAPNPAALALVRIALLLGVLLFGAAIYYIQRRGTWLPATAESLESLRLAGIGIWVMATVAVVLLRLVWVPRTPPGTSNPSIIGWALGEAVALFGGVYFFLSGQHEWYVLGVMFLVATFVVFPIRRS